MFIQSISLFGWLHKETFRVHSHPETLRKWNFSLMCLERKREYCIKFPNNPIICDVTFVIALNIKNPNDSKSGMWPGLLFSVISLFSFKMFHALVSSCCRWPMKTQMTTVTMTLSHNVYISRNRNWKWYYQLFHEVEGDVINIHTSVVFFKWYSLSPARVISFEKYNTTLNIYDIPYLWVEWRFYPMTNPKRNGQNGG